MHIYICLFVYISIHPYIHLSLYVYIYISLSISIYLYPYLYISIYLYLYIYQVGRLTPLNSTLPQTPLHLAAVAGPSAHGASALEAMRAFEEGSTLTRIQANPKAAQAVACEAAVHMTDRAGRTALHAALRVGEKTRIIRL